jgi:hypothetical protein
MGRLTAASRRLSSRGRNDSAYQSLKRIPFDPANDVVKDANLLSLEEELQKVQMLLNQWVTVRGKGDVAIEEEVKEAIGKFDVEHWCGYLTLALGSSKASERFLSAYGDLSVVSALILSITLSQVFNPPEAIRDLASAEHDSVWSKMLFHCFFVVVWTSASCHAAAIVCNNWWTFANTLYLRECDHLLMMLRHGHSYAQVLMFGLYGVGNALALFAAMLGALASMWHLTTMECTLHMTYMFCFSFFVVYCKASAQGHWMISGTKKNLGHLITNPLRVPLDMQSPHGVLYYECVLNHMKSLIKKVEKEKGGTTSLATKNDWIEATNKQTPNDAQTASNTVTEPFVLDSNVEGNANDEQVAEHCTELLDLPFDVLRFQGMVDRLYDKDEWREEELYGLVGRGYKKKETEVGGSEHTMGLTVDQVRSTLARLDGNIAAKRDISQACSQLSLLCKTLPYDDSGFNTRVSILKHTNHIGTHSRHLTQLHDEVSAQCDEIEAEASLIINSNIEHHGRAHVKQSSKNVVHPIPALSSEVPGEVQPNFAEGSSRTNDPSSSDTEAFWGKILENKR